MSDSRHAHVIAGATVMTGLSGYGLSGGVRADTPTAVVLLAASITLAAGTLTATLAWRQAKRGRRDVVRPLVWGAVIAWAAALSLLLDHPASLRSAHPVASSWEAAFILFAPFAGYWTIFQLVEWRRRRRDSS
jgi:uncharacterized membrane protein YfcA